MKTFFRLTIFIPILASFLIGLIFFCLGLYETFFGILGILDGHLHTKAAPGFMFLTALDGFLIGFLFIIFSIGLG